MPEVINMRRDKSTAVGLVICFVAMIAIVGSVTFSNYKNKTKGELAKTEEKKQTVQEEEPTQVTQGTDIQAEIIEEPHVEPSVIVEKNPFSFSEKDTLRWPVDGNVILNYSMDETVYFATLDQYKYNPAILIAGEVGDNVVSARVGKVTSIKSDAQTGNTVTVSLGDGYEVIYGQIGEVCVEEGGTLSEREIIGYLGEPTKYYSVEGCNLYFQLLKDGEPVNPMEFLDM